MIIVVVVMLVVGGWLSEFDGSPWHANAAAVGGGKWRHFSREFFCPNRSENGLWNNFYLLGWQIEKENSFTHRQNLASNTQYRFAFLLVYCAKDGTLNNQQRPWPKKWLLGNCIYLQRERGESKTTYMVVVDYSLGSQ
jgi:hypothetical protein